MANKDEDTIVALDEEHKKFILEEKDLSPNFLGFHSVQVDASECCYIYRDGALYDKLGPGPHHWWNGFFQKWKAQRINLRIEQISLEVSGRVKGPGLPRIAPAAAAGIELACNVTSRLELSCKLIDIGTFLQFRKPISHFKASLGNMVVEEIGKLPYDQYGEWAQALRDAIRRRLASPSRHDNPLLLIGMAVIDVFVTSFSPNSTHDATMMKNFLLVERLRRELMEAQAKKEVDLIKADSYAEQGKRTGLSPAIMILQELKDSPIGRTLIEQDAELQKLRLGIEGGYSPGSYGAPAANQLPQYAGWQPNGYLPPANFQPGTQDNMVNSSTGNTQPGASPFPPISPFGPTQPESSPFPTNSLSGSVQPFSSPFAAGPQISGANSSGSSLPMPPFGPTIGQSTASMPAPDFGRAEEPVAPERREQELQALRQVGLEPAEKIDPSYDQAGHPIPGSQQWTVQVFIQRAQSYLVIIFHCPAGYPSRPPRVQVRQTRGGSRWHTPKSVIEWHPNRWLLEIAQEINNDFPDLP